MKSEVPKQFLKINGKPILFHTLEAFNSYSEKLEIILVLPMDQIEYWKNLCATYDFKVPHKIATGGNSRFQSVKKGLSVINDFESLVAVHDGVRPLINPSIIQKSFKIAQTHGAAVVATKLKESIREIFGDKTIARDRSKYYSIQTPQTFQTKILKTAYEVEESELFTDDASVVENYGAPIYLVDGEYKNIKITTPEDVIFAESILMLEKK